MQGISPRALFALGAVLVLVLVALLAYAVFAEYTTGRAPVSILSSEGGEGAHASGGEQAKLSAFLAAAIAITVSCLSAGAAIYGVATSGFAASAEKPELRTFMLILGGLAEGIAIYGLLVAIMILGKI
jgi:V/A-type H+-transporting ATPase subunit K